MKKLFVCILFIVAAFVSGCTTLELVPPEQREIQTVHDINLSKDEIYSKSIEWMSLKFADSRSVIEHKDKESGKIIGNGIIQFAMPIGIGPAMQLDCEFVMILEAKDNKYRTTYKNLVGNLGGTRDPLIHNPYVNDVMVKLRGLDEDLLNFLKNTKTDSNW